MILSLLIECLQDRPLVEGEQGVPLCVVYRPPDLVSSGSGGGAIAPAFPRDDTISITATIIQGLCSQLCYVCTA